MRTISYWLCLAFVAALIVAGLAIDRFWSLALAVSAVATLLVYFPAYSRGQKLAVVVGTGLSSLLAVFMAVQIGRGAFRYRLQQCLPEYERLAQEEIRLSGSGRIERIADLCVKVEKVDTVKKGDKVVTVTMVLDVFTRAWLVRRMHSEQRPADLGCMRGLGNDWYVALECNGK